MSMLAERKQKQKWTLNPRGKNWSDDANKFGQRMLEKMGWSTGKGLGAKEDGITEHIKQAYKNDSKGIGFEDREDQWTKHEVDFTSLLQNLNSDGIVELKKPEVSLEKKSEGSRRRVHYHKFTRGKDLSRYSEKDLANIFGRKTLQRKEIENVECESNSNSMDSNKDFGVQTVHGGNMADYFKSKLKNVLTKTDKEDSDCERPGFGFGFNQENSLEPVDLKENSKFKSFKNMFVKSEDEKKKKKSKVVINECFDNAGFQDFNNKDENVEKNENESGINVDVQNIVESKKSKKRKLETIVEESNENIVNNEVSEYLPAKKKSKKDKNNLSELNINENNLKKIQNGDDNNDSCKINENIDSNETKSSKKKKKGIVTEETLENTSNSSKKKKKKKISEGIFNEACTELNNDENSTTTEITNKKPVDSSESNDTKTSSKKKKRKNIEGIFNQACTELDFDENNESTKKKSVDINEISDIKENTDSKVSEKKKKRKEGINIDQNTTVSTISNEKTIDDSKISDNINLKSSNKKKKRKNNEGIFNEACTELNIDQNINNTEITNEKSFDVNINENIDIKSSSKKKKCKINDGIVNEACTEVNIEPNIYTSENLNEKSVDLTKTSDNYENVDIKSSSKKKKRKITNGIVNEACTEITVDENSSIGGIITKKSVKISEIQNNGEIKSSKKKKNSVNVGIYNVACTEDNIKENNESVEQIVFKKSKNKKKVKLQENGVENLACTANSAQQNIEETISSMSNAIDNYQLELENEMNERKASRKVLYFKQNKVRNEKFNRNLKQATKSVKDVIVGDLRYNFEGSNLPKIPGYGVHR